MTQDGVTRGISLWHVFSPNLIDQIVDTPNRTITDIALPGHAFLGQVVTRVEPMGSGPVVTAVGTGTGDESWLRGVVNDVAGFMLFGIRNFALEAGCDAANGIPNHG